MPPKFPNWYYDFIEVLVKNCKPKQGKKTPIYVPIADNIPQLHRILKSHDIEHTPEHIISIANESLSNMAGHIIESEHQSIHGILITRELGKYFPQFYIEKTE